MSSQFFFFFFFLALTGSLTLLPQLIPWYFLQGTRDCWHSLGVVSAWSPREVGLAESCLWDLVLPCALWGCYSLSGL